jgi:succinate-acetate transporter protein
VTFTLLTAIFFIGAIRMSAAHGVLFLTLLLGFIFLDISHLGNMPVFTIIAAIDLIVCALTAWYVMAHVALTPLKMNLPLGKPWVK